MRIERVGPALPEVEEVHAARTVEPIPPSAPAASPLDHTAWTSLLARKPELAARVPAELTSSNAKLLWVIAHARGEALTVHLADGDSIRRETNGSLTLRSAHGSPIRLSDSDGDFARLMDAHLELYESLEHTTVDALLTEAVHRFHARPEFDGGGAAQNFRGGNTFAFATVQQVLVSDDPSQRGIECLGAAAIHLWKSWGLVPPQLSREEFEHRFTSIHGDAARGTPRLGTEFDRTLRGFPSSTVLTAQATADFANALRAGDWAKLTGAANGRYTVQTLSDVDAVVNHFARGGGGVRTQWANGGHYFVLTGARREGDDVVVNPDDSLRGRPRVRKSERDEPYLESYDPSSHTRFWTLRRTTP